MSSRPPVSDAEVESVVTEEQVRERVYTFDEVWRIVRMAQLEGAPHTSLVIKHMIDRGHLTAARQISTPELERENERLRNALKFALAGLIAARRDFNIDLDDPISVVIEETMAALASGGDGEQG